MLNEGTYYDLLAVSPEATVEQIRRAYRTKMRTAHPDHGGSEEEARQLSAAYEALKDPARRRDYDLELADEQLGYDVEVVHAEEVVDDWGAETPIHQPAPPGNNWSPPPPPSRWPEGSYGPPVLPHLRPWHRVWLFGHGAWVRAARALTVAVLVILVGPWLIALAFTAAGQTSWSQLPINTFAWLVTRAIVVLPYRRRSMGGRITWPYVIFCAFGFGGALLQWRTSPTTSVIFAGWTALMVSTAEVRHYTIVSGRGRTV